MINGVANQTLSRGTELKDNTTEVKSITYKLEDKDGKDVSANTGCDITMGRNTMTVQTVSFPHLLLKRTLVLVLTRSQQLLRLVRRQKAILLSGLQRHSLLHLLLRIHSQQVI